MAEKKVIDAISAELVKRDHGTTEVEFRDSNGQTYILRLDPKREEQLITELLRIRLSGSRPGLENAGALMPNRVDPCHYLTGHIGLTLGIGPDSAVGLAFEKKDIPEFQKALAALEHLPPPSGSAH